MAHFQPIQGEEIVLSSDMEQYVLEFKEGVQVFMVQVYSKDGVLKNLKVNGNTISSNGKVVLNAGDTIKYIAII